MSSPMVLDAPPPGAPTRPSEGGRGGISVNDVSPSTWRTDQLVNRLPREIISEIFVKTCDVDNAAECTYESTTRAPLRLSHVSKLWRDVACSTLSLWTHLHVSVRRADVNPALELVKLWVPRCNHRPLKVDVTFRDEHGPFILYPEDSLNLFRLITKTAALLRKGLDYELDKAYFETHVKAGSSGVMPVIEEKYLWYLGVDDVPRKEDLANLPLVARGVRRAVDEFGYGYHEPLAASLTRLELQDSNGTTCLSTTELLIILAEFRQLRFVSAYLDHGDIPPDEQVFAPNLLTFRLAWAYTTDPGELFDHLVVPRLQEIELSGDVPAAADWLHLYDFFERSRPPITTLALEHFDATRGVTRLGDCLALCSSLESLWLEGCIVDDDFIASLGRRSSLAEESVLSRLRIFGLVSAEDVTGHCLVQTLRNADRTKLKEVFVFDCDLVTLEQCNTIEEMFKRTADVTVQTIIVTPGEPMD